VVWQALRSGDWDVHAFTLTEEPVERDSFHCTRFDLCETEVVAEALRRIQPHAVIHTAALADIDFCEGNKDMAQRVNVGVTRDLATLCAELGSKLIFCSTDTVFDGEKGMYTEEDAPRALNHYAKTKIESEGIVRDTLQNAVVARLSLVMGLPVMGAGNSFLARMIDSLEKGQQVKFPANEIRTPLDVITGGRAFLEMAASDFTGTIHLASTTRINRYEMACHIAERLGYSRDAVVATDSNAMPGRAPRPNDASLDNSKAQRVLSTPMQSLDGGLDLVLNVKAEQDKASVRG
jgi:dTDP-4-dehydrorhamnose reductase